MTPSSDSAPSSTEAVDWIFTYYSAQPSWDRQSSGRPGAGPSSSSSGGLDAPPEIKDSSDLRVANEWLQREWERLKEYTEMQLARIQKESQNLVNQNHLNEQTMVLNCQELSRHEELLARQSRALQKQAEELSERERALADQFKQWSGEPAQGHDAPPARTLTAEEASHYQTLVENLRLETLALQKSRETTQAELEAMARSLDEHREARAREQALLRAHQSQMEQRHRALDKAEQAAQRRVAELDEMETRLREEFEEQDRQLAERRRDVNAMYARLRQDSAARNAAPPPATEVQADSLIEVREALAREEALLRTHQAQVEQRRRAVEKAEQAALRRSAELDELEARLRQGIEEQERQLTERRREVAALYARLRQEMQARAPALAASPAAPPSE